MKYVESKPWKGGMNQDDDLENLPLDDYETGENLILGLGDNAFEKLAGTTSLTPYTGNNAIGWFRFNDYSVLFTHLPSPDKFQITLIYNDDSIEAIFYNDLDIDESLQISDCYLINEKILVFTNGVDEIQKIHIDMGRASFSFAGGNALSVIHAGYPERFEEVTLGESDGYLTLTHATGFTTGTKRLYIAGEPTSDETDLENLNILVNHSVNGYLSSSTVFVTDIRIEGDFSDLDGDTYYVQYDINVQFGYRGISTKEYRLINVPPLDPPEIQFLTNEVSNKNGLTQDVFQFQAKYVYADGTHSVWSPMSKILLIERQYADKFLKNNEISVSINNPKDYGVGTVQSVVFGVRKNEGSLYEFDEVDVIKKSTNVGISELAVSTIFKNDSILTAVADNEAASLYDRIFKSSTIGVINNSRIVIGGSNSNQVNVSPNVELIAEGRDIDADAPTDWGHAFHYEKLYTKASIGKQFSYSTDVAYWAGEMVQIFVQNRDFKGDLPAYSGSFSNPEHITESYSNIRRYRRPTGVSSYQFLEFGSPQVVGTQYKLSLTGNSLHPNNYAFTGQIFSHEKTFTVTDTDPDVLAAEIKDWWNSLANLPYGRSGNYIEYYAYDQTDVSGGYWDSLWEAPTASANSQVVFVAGLGGSSPTTSDYHWHQVKEFSLYMQRVTFPKGNNKVMKRDASHPFAIQYYDDAGRIISNAAIGSLDVKGNYSSDVETIYDKVKLKIYHDAPEEAAKYQILYAGNSDYKNIVAIEAGTVVTNTANQEVPFSFTSFNDAYGASLSYTFTEGDLLVRFKDWDGVSAFNNLAAENTIPVRILSESSGTLTVEHNSDNPIETDDILFILTPKLETDDDQTLYYEIGECFDVIDGVHQGDQTKGDIIPYNLSIQISTNRFLESVDAGDFYNKLFIRDIGGILADVYGKKEITISNFEGDLLGTYDILVEYEGASTHPDLGYNGIVINLEWDSVFWGAVDTALFVRLLYNIDTAVVVSNTSIYPYTQITLDGIGDTYLRYRGTGYESRVESFSMSDTKDLPYWGKGRPSTILSKTPPSLSNHVFYTEPYFANESYNGISTVFGSNFEEYNFNYGGIKKIAEKDDILLIFHKNKVSWAAVNKAMISTADGDTLTSQTGDVISPVENFFDYEGGIGDQIHSLKIFENSGYFADNINRNLCRIVGNKIVEVSKIKMDSYFNTLFKDESVQIYSDYDRETRSYVAHIKSDSINRQLIFREEDNRWKYFWDLDCERLLFCVNELKSYEGQEIYNHTGSDKNDIYGSPVMSKIIKTFSQPNTSQKVWTNMMMDPLFSDDDANKIEITNEEGQVSELISSDFSRDGSGYWAEILRDESSPNMGGLDPLLEGDELQSKTLTVEIKTDSTDNIKLNRIGLKFIDLESKS